MVQTIRVARWTPTRPPLEGVAGEPPSLQEVERGWRFAHMMMTLTQIETREALAFARALGDLLLERGLVTREELQARLNEARAGIEEHPLPKVMLARGGNKYAPENNVRLDCLERLPICKARCCTLNFCLTEEDLDEGVARWDYGQPYWIRKRADGYCVHCDPETFRCRIFAHRPFVCRTYDCRQDPRIWSDFENGLLAPLEQPGV
jgi:hypothetical protein